MPRLTVFVYESATGKPIPGLKVYLFKGGGGIQPPETADYSKPTDALGEAVFEVYNFFRVAIADKGYEAADIHQAAPAEWRPTYSAWGAIAVFRDETYDFPLIRLAVEKKPLALVGSLAFTGFLLIAGFVGERFKP